MSYILDALRRADAERERGAVPGLHAQPLPTGPYPADGLRRSSRWLLPGGAAVLLVAGALLLWALLRQPSAPDSRAGDGTPAGVATAPTATALPATAAPTSPGTTSPGTTSPGTATPATSLPVTNPPVTTPPATPIPATTPRATDALTPPRAEVMPPQPPRPRADAEPRPLRVLPAEKRGTGASSRPADPLAARNARDAKEAAPADIPPSAQEPANPGRRVYALDELPPEIRRGLPAISVSGSIYSEDAASRFVMINGEAVHEGGRLGPELVLEQIGLKSAVLRYKGYRYRIGL